MGSWWPPAVAEILDGDQAVVLASVTPAHGVVPAPMTNFATNDAEAGTVSVNSSIGAPRKLGRIRANPHVALAFHTREHGFSDRPEYVLVQGTATLSEPRPDFPDALGEKWERFDGPRGGPLWTRWLRVYRTRVSIDVAVTRVLVWPDLAATGPPEVHGTALPGGVPPAQQPPARGTGPRIDVGEAVDELAALPNRLLGWVGTDGFPMVVPVEVARGEQGIHVRGPALPAGGRRAGLTAHAFRRYVRGQHQRVHTGWLEVDAGGHEAVYAPHTGFGYRLPDSAVVHRFAVGRATRRGARAARRHVAAAQRS